MLVPGSRFLAKSRDLLTDSMLLTYTHYSRMFSAGADSDDDDII